MDDFKKTKDYMLGYVDGRSKERDRIVTMLKEWKRHQDIMSDPKSFHYSMCIKEILDRMAEIFRLESSGGA